MNDRQAGTERELKQATQDLREAKATIKVLNMQLEGLAKEATEQSLKEIDALARRKENADRTLAVKASLDDSIRKLCSSHLEIVDIIRAAANAIKVNSSQTSQTPTES